MDKQTKTVLLVTCAFVVVACLIFLGSALQDDTSRQGHQYDALYDRVEKMTGQKIN